MKQVFFKSVFSAIAISGVATLIGTTTNACDKNLVVKTCLVNKQVKKQDCSATTNEMTEYPDFILTNTLLRF